MYNKPDINKIEESLKLILETGRDVISDSVSDVAFGWVDATIGDVVYFRSYDDANDAVVVSKGEVVGVETIQYRVYDNPTTNPDGDKTHIETSISYTILWGNKKVSINSRYVYKDKLRACLVALHDTINSYFTI